MIEPLNGWDNFIKSLTNNLNSKFVKDLDKLWESESCSYCDFEDHIFKLINKYKVDVE